MTTPDSPAVTLNSDQAVAARYAAAAETREESLCCPVAYRPDLLQMIPQEIIEKDYGCGDPSAHVRPGDVVLDLGSGGGKLCYMAAQLTGPQGRVIGVDCNLSMLALARKYQDTMSRSLGYSNVEFHYGRIQDLGLDLDLFHHELQQLPAGSPSHPLDVLNLVRSLRAAHPMVADNSVDCVISNCVLNLVHPEDRRQLFGEIFRVLRPGGRAAISDIVCDEDVPPDMQRDAALWSGCLSGAWREDLFLREFEQAGFHGVRISAWQTQPWQTIRGIEFRSVTVTAYKETAAPALECGQAVIYRGPFQSTTDDDGRAYHRGQRVAVSDRTFRRLMQEPYAGLFVPIEPLTPVSLLAAELFDDSRPALRSPRETKGHDYKATGSTTDNACRPGDGCC